MKKICTYDKTIEDDIVESTVESLVCVDGESSGSGLPTAPIVEIGFRRHSLGVLLVALVVVSDRASQPTRSPNELFNSLVIPWVGINTTSSYLQSSSDPRPRTTAR